MKTLKHIVFFVGMFNMPAAAFDPYVFFQTEHEYSYGGYAVIDSTKNKVAYTGNIIGELISDPTFYAQHEFLSNNDAIGDYYIDRKFGRLFIWTGLRDEYYDGSIILKLSDRSLITYVHTGSGWGEASAVTDVGPDNVIYEMSWGDFGGPSDPVENAKEAEGIGIFNGETYEKIKFTRVPKFGISSLSSCFLPGENKIYDDLNGGLFDVAKNELIRPKNPLLKNYEQLDCKNGKVLTTPDRDGPLKPGTLTLNVYDVLTDKLVSTFKPPLAGGLPWYEWKLSHDGKYAIWGDSIEHGSHHFPAYINSGKIAVYSTETGKEVARAVLSKLFNNKGTEIYRFNGFSVDGKKMLFWGNKYLYVVSIDTLKVLNRVKLDGTPDFVVWP